MTEYKAAYLHLFNAVTDILVYVETDPIRAKLDLKMAQQEAEELFLSQDK